MINKTTIEVWRAVDPDYGKRLELNNAKDGILKKLAGTIKYWSRLVSEHRHGEFFFLEYFEAIQDRLKFLSDCNEYDCNKNLEYVICVKTKVLAHQKRRRVRRTHRMSI